MTVAPNEPGRVGALRRFWICGACLELTSYIWPLCFKGTVVNGDEGDMEVGLVIMSDGVETVEDEAEEDAVESEGDEVELCVVKGEVDRERKEEVDDDDDDESPC
jgi:hypothetical protein